MKTLTMPALVRQAITKHGGESLEWAEAQVATKEGIVKAWVTNWPGQEIKLYLNPSDPNLVSIRYLSKGREMLGCYRGRVIPALEREFAKVESLVW